MFAGSMCCKVGTVLARRGGDASSCSEGEPHPAYCTVGCSSVTQSGRGAGESVDTAETGKQSQTRHPTLALPQTPAPASSPPSLSFPPPRPAVFQILLSVMFLTRDERQHSQSTGAFPLRSVPQLLRLLHAFFFFFET